MTADVIYLPTLRAGRSVPVMPLGPRTNPEETIRMACDRSMIDRVREWVEAADGVTRYEPLHPHDRSTLIRLVAIIQPEAG